MKGKTVETVPFAFRFFLVNRFTKERFGPFDSIEEAKSFRSFRYEKYRWHYWASELYSDSLPLDRREREKVWLDSLRSDAERRYERPFCIMTHLGDVVHPDEIKAASGRYVYRNNGWEARNKKRNIIKVGLVKRKGDGNKIKSDWAYRESWNTYTQEIDFTNDSFGYFRRISTTAEHRANAGCDADYGQGFVRGARRGHNLPNSWDDVQCGAYGLSACWKHNSKRRKQWKPK